MTGTPASIPPVAALAEQTVELMRSGVIDSATMRIRIAAGIALRPDDPGWPRLVNSHAWALVRLQAEGTIEKVATGRYALIVGRRPLTASVPPFIPIEDHRPLPAWAAQMVGSASNRNRRRWGAERFEQSDLRLLWASCGGHCALTGLPFSEEAFGTGMAKRAYAPSLDRIDPQHPYTRANCRIVLVAVNFALNSFGEDVLARWAAALVGRQAQATTS